MTARIPFLDLGAQHAEIADEVAQGFERILATTTFLGGPDVDAFESEFAAYQGVGHAIGLANGTDAVEFALRAVGVGPGDEVVMPANTFVATAEAAWRIGAKVVLVDIDPESYLMDLAAAAAARTSRTRAVVPVHLFGRLVDIPALRDRVGEVAVVEDAAQAQGARLRGRAAGQGGIAATSFYPGKNLGAYGDAGAVVTDSAEFGRYVRRLGGHGGLVKYEHDIVGFTSRLDALQAVVLRAKLAHLDEWNARRRHLAQRYDDLLADLPILLPEIPAEAESHVWHLYVVRLPDDAPVTARDEVLARLTASGVGTGIHYPKPVHLTPAFADLGYSLGAFPHAERAAERMFSLPMYPHLSDAQQDEVVAALTAALQ
ncbi:DegT/DnrJ/EryC1/StrS family aminotransferase [Protaetiibacter intestinalis]|uniref:DegT/DnrJ/EryC1/StrS family aminotransferase n=1 Tax=Protaetiibacter intestinalis TaxID=2419774 RepID=A0A387BBK8_9MICO|nr:DegT/DnrJ/EryC1/StrS family aminotransferase [Protaetiibacter intestinalis]AYF98339.1 DegT/DnrJ/EryC1/StrS family aminotransferase [Protaetiibacter intestinalis]